jgi:hypothetical protein
MNLKQIQRHQVVVSIISLAAAGWTGVTRLLKRCPTPRQAAPSPSPAATDSSPSLPTTGPAADVTLPAAQWFYFRSRDSATGAVARSLQQLESELEAATPDVIGHHSGNADFSRWVREVVDDEERARALAIVETDIRNGATDTVTGRQRLLEALRGQKTA